MSSSHMDVFNKLKVNSEECFKEATRLLLKVADNILKSPGNSQVRILRKTNKLVQTKILGAKGGKECLQLMGFLEKSEDFVFPENASLNKLEEVKSNLQKLQEEVNSKQDLSQNTFAKLKENLPTNKDTTASDSTDSSSDSSEDSEQPTKKNSLPHDVPLVKLPPLSYIFTHPFLNHIENRFHCALAYQDKNLIERAKKIIPVKNMEDMALRKLRSLQEQLKKGKITDPEISLQELLLLELLDWFKNDFFSWVDSPKCDFCGDKAFFIEMSTDATLMTYTNRIEVYECNSCQNKTYFPRYNDVNILLITRRGRCGEWANTFTLLCFAMGWDARLIEDQTDHVWTEVYSPAQKRWLHCDPCENACDTPLMYESGWKKQISYILAYSPEEVQDVTWRYTSNHGEVLRKRNKCSEQELIEALITLRNNRQSNLSQNRRDYLTKRLISELAELLKERKPEENEKEGRSSGSLQWRLARGEIREEITPYIWKISEKECTNNPLIIGYSASLDHYMKKTGDGKKTILKKWISGVFESESIFRKEERDWKMVYLARKEGSDSGKLTWKFEVQCEKYVIDKIEIRFERKLYENGKVNVQLCSETTCLNFPGNQSIFSTSAFSNTKVLLIKASLLGGKGDIAWQHSQIFRQESDSYDYPFQTVIYFKRIKS